jgi:hypothetical protein
MLENMENMKSSLSRWEALERKWSDRFERSECESASLRQSLAETQQELASLKAETKQTKQGLAETKQGMAETKQGMASSEQGLAETKQGMASLEQGLAETKQDVDILLPYLEDMQILRKDILERQDKDSRDYDITKRRNRIAHGGHVKGDAEAIDQEPEGSTAEKWKLAFGNIYGHGYDTIRPLLSIAPRALICILNLRADTVLLHPPRSTISEDVRTNLRMRCDEVLGEWIKVNGEQLGEEMKGKSDQLASEYGRWLSNW